MKSESLRQQLQEAEDGLVGARRELIQAHRELQDVVHDRDRQRKDALDLRRLLGDEAREKESIQASNQELRALVKRAESDNSRYRSVGPLFFFDPIVSNQLHFCNTKEHSSHVILLNNVVCLFNQIYTTIKVMYLLYKLHHKNRKM